mmetsp:Transcript_19118/g.40299  ORF Transcript_19118/g.40299 Transcript_19118/m.40299 type:complete len:97 (-) Transcript_19118:35-325(-)
MPKTLDSPISQLCAATGGESASMYHSGSVQICVSKKRNLEAPVSIDNTTAGNKTPGQKNEAGNGVMVNNHAVASATRLDIPEMYAMIRETYHVWSF